MNKPITRPLRLILLLVTLLLPTASFAYDFEVDGIYYEKKSSTEVEVTYYSSSSSSNKDAYSGEVIIPEKVIYNDTEYSLTSIGSSAFSGCSSLTSITIPSSITSIGRSVFHDCIGLKELIIEDGTESLSISYNGSFNITPFSDCPLESVYIGRDIESIDFIYGPFSNIPSIESLIIGDSVTKIEPLAFNGCSGLTDIKIPNLVTSIGYNAFYECSSLSNITIPNSVTSIGANAFANCSSLLDITIPASVTTIEDNVFSGCSNLKNITIEASTNYLRLKGTNLFRNCPLETVYIGRNLSGDNVFSEISSIETLTVGSLVTTIYDKTFSNCSGLKELVFEDGQEALSIGAQVFRNCILGTVYIGRNLSYDNSTSPLYCKSGNMSVTIGNTVSEISDNMFYGDSNLTNIKLPNSVTSIGRNAFNGCSGLTSIAIPNSVTSIGNQAFVNCTGIKELTIEDGESTLSLGYLSYDCPLEKLYLGRNLAYNASSSGGYSPFYNRTTLTSLTISNSVTEIGDCTFYNCSGLTSVTIPNSVTKIGDSAFKGCSGLTSVTIPTSVTEIGNYAFNECTGIKELTIEDGESTLSLGYNGYNKGLFYDCPLEKLHLGRNLLYQSTSLYGYSPFFNLTTLKSVTMGDPVNSIGESAFRNCSGLTSVTIPNSVTEIGNYAFNGCSGIKELTIEDGESILSLGYNSSQKGLFYDCALEKLYLGRNLVYDTSNSPFCDNKTLTSVTISNTVTSIGLFAFGSCSSLTSVTIPSSVTEIGFKAFSGCSGLPSLTIPASVTSIGDNTFYECSGLTSISLPNSITSIGDYAFYGCSGLTSLSLPNSVTAIGNQAFSKCIGLTEISIPNSIVSIENSAFYNCQGVKILTIESGDESLNLGSSAFSGSPLESIYLGRNIIYNSSPFSGNTNLASIVIGNLVTSVSDNAFNNCNGLKSATIEDGEETLTIGNKTFYNCPLESLYLGRNLSYTEAPFSDKIKLSSLVIGNYVTAIGPENFYGCSSLTSVNIPNSVKYIGERAFSGCTGLTTLDVPVSVTSIDDGAFAGCSGLKNIIIPNSLTTLSPGVLSDCTNLTEITIPNSITSIGETAFAGCSNLTSITIPNSVTSIGNNAFNKCSNLKDLTFSDGADIVSLGNNNSKGLFSDCPLMSVYLGRGLSYGNSPFSGKSDLTSLTIGNSVSRIGDSLFNRCSGLTSLTIPNTINSIGDYAFYGCIGLSGLTIPASVKTIGDYAFYGCSGFESLTLEGGLTSIGNYAFSSLNLLEIVSDANIAPTLFNNSFSDFSYDYAQVFIPKASVNSYKDGWSRFKHFVSAGSLSKKIYYVDKPGDLLNLISINDIEDISEVKLVGSINGTDNLCLNRMVNLTSIDLSECTIVSGGMPYYEKDNERFGTEDNTLGENWAYNLNILNNIILPQNLSVIADNAFKGQRFLTSMDIPKSVSSIGNNAFDGCIALTKITLENGSQQLRLGSSSNRKSIFSDCPLEILHLGRNLSYDVNPFRSKSTLSTLTIGDTVTSIDNHAFDGCNAITEVIIPNSITSIGDYAFNDCTSLTYLTIGKSVSSIGEYAFSNCSHITSIIIPNSVTSIGDYSFKNCTGLKELSLEDGSTTLTLGDNGSQKSLFSYCPLETIYLGRNLSYNVTPFQRKTTLLSLTVGDKVNSIDSYSFDGCSALNELNISSSITSIGNYAFRNCSSLTDLIIPNSVTSIGNYSFSECTGLRDIPLPASIISIGSYAFSECSALTSVSIPDPVTELPEYAFADCSALQSVTLPGSLREIDATTFSNCNAITEIYMINPIPAVIESSTFASCEAKATLNVPDGSMGIYWIHPYWGKFKNLATWNSGSEEDFVIDDVTYHITSVADATVEITAANITSRSRAAVTLDIPETVEFKGMTYRVTGVANNGFEGSEISALILPKTISYVGLEAFKNCNALSSITCMSTLPPSVNNNSFDEATYAKASLKVPEDAVSAYKQHAVWQLFDISEAPQSAIIEVADDAEVTDGTFDIYNIRGMLIKKDAVADDLKELMPDVYIIRQGYTTRKLLLR